MTNRLGMDAGLIRGYADQMDGLAAALDSIVGSVNGSVGQISTTWLGADAHELAQRWHYRDREAVAILATHVRELARTARINAGEQDQASSVSGGISVSATRGAGVGGPDGRTSLDAFEARLSGLTSVLGATETVKRLDSVLRDVSWFKPSMLHLESGWHSTELLAAGAGTTLMASRLLSHVHVPPAVLKGAGQVTSGSVRALGNIGAVVTVGTKAIDATDDFGSGRTSAGVYDVADGTAAGLKSVKNPVVWLSGVVIAEYTDVAKTFQATDWSQPLPAPTPSNLSHMYLPAVGDAVASLPGHIWKWVS